MTGEEHARAACRGMDPDLFFPPRGDGGGLAWARAICETCPVREPCWLLSVDLHITEGVWGGMSEAERRTRRRTEGITFRPGTSPAARARQSTATSVSGERQARYRARRAAS